MDAWREVDVLIIASGLTEREALPHLLRESTAKTGRRIAVLFPPNNRSLTAAIAAQLIKANYWGLYPRPTKAVVLVDADSLACTAVEEEMKAALNPLIVDLTERGLAIHVVSSKWQLEAWFFGDPTGLTTFLGRDLGNVDVSDPDAIPNPKNHLRKLLERLYTSRVSGAIAQSVVPAHVRGSSLSFAAFEVAVENGPA